MPGAWEESGPQVLVATLTREIVSTEWAKGYRNIILPPGSPPPTTTSGQPYDSGRNHLAQLVVDNNIPWILYIDDDVIPPPDVFFQLARHKKEIVSGLYFRRHNPPVPVMQKDRRWVTQWNPPNSIIEVDWCGAGCLLVSRSVFLKVPKPWFEWRCDREDFPPEQRLSEDFVFCEKARASGFKVLVDTSVKCLHVGYGRAEEPGVFVPLLS